MTTFIEKFHSIEGVTIGERKRNFHALLKAELLNENQDELVKNLVPKTFLESLFRLEILIWLKRKNELLELLKEGNDIYTSKIIKDGWCFQEVFNDVSIEELVNQFLPELSYSVRMKVLKKVSGNFCEEKNDKLFDALMDRYGLFLATNFLCYCTVEKITDVLRNHEIKLHSGHLQIFFKKDPNLVLIYAEEYYKNTDKHFSDTKFLKYISQRDLDFFFKLRDKCKMSVKVGTRTTKKIIELKKDDIIANPKSYTGILKPSAVARKLQKDFEQFYFNLFPKQKVPNEVDYCSWYLRHAPSKRQYSLLADTYKKVYNKDITENEDWMGDTEILECMMSANPEKCEVVAKKEYDKSNDNNFLKFLPLSKSIPILKDKINLTSNINDRRNLCQLMVDFCAYHKDLKVLEDVMAYFCKRHRNDDTYTRHNFLSTITRHFKWKEFNESHWNYLVDMWKVCSMKDSYQPFSMVLYQYVEFLYRNDKPIKEYLELMVSNTIKLRELVYFFDEEYDPDLRRTYYMKLIDEIPKQKTKKEHIVDLDYSLMCDIVNFNKKFPDKAVDWYSVPRFVEYLTNINPDDITYQLREVIKSMVCKKNRNEIDNNFKDFLLNHLDGFYLRDDIVTWYFKNDIKSLVPVFERVVDCLMKSRYVNFWYQIKKYEHLDLGQKSALYIKQHVEDREEMGKDNTGLRGLAIILPQEEFLSYVETYIPKSDKIDLEDVKETEIYEFRCSVAQSVKFMPKVSKVLPVLLHFCKGDYLKSSRHSLYSVSYRVPENHLDLHLETLSSRSVSVRKHALFLACNIFKRQVVMDKLKEFGSKETNSSLKKHLYSASVNYFVRNPSEETWYLVKTYMDFIDTYDSESLKQLCDCNITKKYFSLYWQCVWEYFEKNKQNITKSPSYMATLLSKVNKELILGLPYKLSENIISESFLNKENKISHHHGITKFAVYFLLYENRADTHKLVFDLVEKYKEAHWKHPNVSHNDILTFFNEFIEMFDNEVFTKDTVIKFSAFWESVFTPVEAFKQYVVLKIIKIFKESEGNLDLYSKSVASFIEETYTVYGPLIISKLAGFIQKINEKCLKEDDELIFIENVAKYKQTVACDVIALELVSKFGDGNDKVKEIMKRISESDNISFQILLNLKANERSF